MLRNLFYYHILPLVAALVIITLFYFIVPSSPKKYSLKNFEGKETVEYGIYANFDQGIDTELALISSINSKNQITLFGSSELSGKSDFFPSNFLKKECNLYCLSFGRAHHQHLSILCELMAAKDYLKNSKITILMSPGWFEETGTNPQAFVEFVRPNFLKKIITDSTINNEYKLHIGEYIYKHDNYFTQMSKEMNYLKDFYLLHSKKDNMLLKIKLFLQTYHANRFYTDNVRYIPAKPVNTERKQLAINIDSLMHSLQTEFMQNVQNNLYVEQSYYETYLLEENKEQLEGKVEEIDYLNTQELKDFEMVLWFLKDNNVNASFVILPLNPYYYKNLSAQENLINYLDQKIKKANFPLLNMYCSDTTKYTPGTLKDVMHVGDYGWVKINLFLEKIYNTHE